GLYSARDEDVALARLDRVRSHADGLQRRRAVAVDGDARRLDPREERGDPRHIGTRLARRLAATPDHVLDLRGVEPGHLGEHRGDDECREVVGATLDERALVRASDRRAGSGDDDGFGHDPLRIASDGWSTLVL